MAPKRIGLVECERRKSTGMAEWRHAKKPQSVTGLLAFTRPKEPVTEGVQDTTKAGIVRSKWFFPVQKTDKSLREFV